MTVVRSGSATDIGRVRNTNQDLAYEGLSLFAVADGMGGHVGGEVAARIAVEALQSAFSRQASVAGLRQAVVEANAAVWQRSQAQDELRGMGTTLTAAALVAQDDGRDVIALANVGDSRAYVYSHGRLTQVTADHSLAEEKVRHGELTEAQAAVHPHRHILTRALGVSPDVDVDLWELHLQSGDRILLCSDGLTNEVSTEEITEILSAEAEPSEAARALVRMANENGGNDNITVVVIDVLVGEEGVGGDDATAGIAGPTDNVAQGGVPSDGDPSAEAPSSTSPGLVAGSAASAMAGAPLSGDQSVAGNAPKDEPGSPAENGESTGPEGTETPTRRERRRQRSRERRLAGIPRRITLRVMLFIILVAAVLAGGYGVLRWYGTDNWYVTLDGSHLAIYQGRPGGFLWFEPKLVDRTNVTTSEVLSFHVPALRTDQQQSSLAAAKRYIADLHQEYVEQQLITSGQSTAPTTTKPPSSTTTTTAPTRSTLAG